MIFVTVGAQMPFDRLIRAVDAWASSHPGEEVFAQIGEGEYEPAHMQWARFLEPAAFGERIASADFIVAHAGTGSIISALGAGRPIVVMPRRSDLRETRNDHQLATVSRLCKREGIAVAEDERALVEQLDRLSSLPTPPRLSPYASDSLIEAISGFLRG